MPECECPTCGAAQVFVQPKTPLERRRFPRGRWACTEELQPWHLRLEAAWRELAVCNSESRKQILQQELQSLQPKTPAILRPQTPLSRSA